MNSLTWKDSYVVAPPGRGAPITLKAKAGTPHDAAFDVAF